LTPIIKIRQKGRFKDANLWLSHPSEEGRLSSSMQLKQGKQLNLFILRLGKCRVWGRDSFGSEGQKFDERASREGSEGRAG